MTVLRCVLVILLTSPEGLSPGVHSCRPLTASSKDFLSSLAHSTSGSLSFPKSLPRNPTCTQVRVPRLASGSHKRGPEAQPGVRMPSRCLILSNWPLGGPDAERTCWMDENMAFGVLAGGALRAVCKEGCDQQTTPALQALAGLPGMDQPGSGAENCPDQ